MKKIIFILCGFYFLTGCGGSSDVEVSISFPAAFVVQATVDRIVLRVTATDPTDTSIPIPIVAVLNSTSFPTTAVDTVTMSATVPVGTGRLFEIFAPLRNSGNAMMAGRRLVDVTTSTSGRFTVPAINMGFVNFAEDARGSGDVRSTLTTQPDLVSFKVFTTTVSSSGCPSNSVVFVVDFDDAFVFFGSVESHRIVIELDTDDNDTTGSLLTLTESFHSTANADGLPLTNAFTRGSEIAFMVINTINGPVVHVLDVRTGSLIPISGVTASANFDPTQAIMNVCVDTTNFATLIDADGVGRLNVLSGIDFSSSSFAPSTTFLGNDVLYRADAIRYDFGLNLGVIPVGP